MLDGRKYFVAWVGRDDPWVLEDEFIRKISLPLNLQRNDRQPFYIQLKAIRKAYKSAAI